MAWIQLSFQTSAPDSEKLSDLLSELGSCAVTIQDAEDNPIYEPPPGSTPLWESNIVTGLFEDSLDTQAFLAKLESHWGTLPAYKISALEDQDWVRSWMDDFKPMQFGERLWICPSWHEPPNPDAVNIMLDPGLAFGTGTHPTTSLCLSWLDTKVQPGQVIIDYGCGSGILAIAALMLGAEKVHGIDLDPQALDATHDNAQKNNQLEKLTTYLPNAFYQQCPDLKCDILVANILAGPLIELSDALAKLVKPNGQIVLSGILAEQGQKIRDCYEKWFELEPTEQLGDWVRISGTRR